MLNLKNTMSTRSILIVINLFQQCQPSAYAEILFLIKRNFFFRFDFFFIIFTCSLSNNNIYYVPVICFPFAKYLTNIILCYPHKQSPSFSWPIKPFQFSLKIIRFLLSTVQLVLLSKKYISWSYVSSTVYSVCTCVPLTFVIRSY